MSKSNKLEIELNRDGIQFSDHTQKKKIIYDILQIVLLYFATYSTLNCFSSGIELPIDMKKVNLFIFFFCTISVFMVTYRNEYKKVQIAIKSSFIIICIFSRGILLDGIKAILMVYLARYNEYYWGESRYQFLTIEELQNVISIGIILLLVFLFVIYITVMLRSKKTFCYGLLLMPVLLLYSYWILYEEYHQGGSRYESLISSEITSAMETVMMVFAIFLSYLFAKIIIKSKKSIYYSLLSVPFVFCGFIVGKIPDLMPLLLYSAMSVVIFGSYIVPNHSQLKKKEEMNEINRTSSRIRIKQESILFFFSCTFFVLAALFLTEKNYKEIDLMEKKEALQMELKRISTAEVFEGTIFESMWKEKKGLSKGGLSNGAIGTSSGVSFNNTTELLVNINGVQMDESIYLRGYIGQQYSENKWDALSEKSQKQLSELKEQYSIETVDATVSNVFYLMSLWEGKQREIREISVQNVGEEKEYFYVPYYQKGDAFVDSDGFLKVPYCNAFESIFYTYEQPFEEGSLYEQIREQNEINIEGIEAWLDCSIEKYDTRRVSKEAKEYMDEILAVSYLENGRTQVDGICDNWDEKKVYLLTEIDGTYTYKDFIKETIEIRNQFNFLTEYETFVQTNYLWLPSDQLKSAKALVDGWKEEGRTKKNQSEDFYKDCILKIKDYFNEHTSYNLNPGAVPEGKEAVDYFLFENPNGYCMYYATAAVVMLREFGIPARYVEGFVVTQADLMDGVYENEQISSKIKDSNAHAWVEVYKKEVGWVPIEVTPSYESEGIIQIPSENKNSTLSLNPFKPSNNRPSVTKTPTKEPTKTPVVSNKPNKQTAVQTNTNNNEKVDKMVLTILQVILPIIAILLLVGILIFIRIMINKRRRNRMNMENTSKKAILQYRVLQKIFLNRNIVYEDKEPFTVYAKAIQKQFPCFTQEECQKYIYLILKARYHYGWLTKEEGEFTTLFYERLVQEFYQTIGKCKRLYYQYIKFF